METTDLLETYLLINMCFQ